MPYLHWETDRRRSRAAKIVKENNPNRWSPLIDVVEEARITVTNSSTDRVNSDGLLEHIHTHIETQRPALSTYRITPTTIQGQSLLGRLLFFAAALYEAMDGYTDEKLIEKYLNVNPPLHPRRTLDQSYYWTLKDTCSRDRDQVVYRDSAPNRNLLHYRHVKKNPKKGGNPTCPQCTDNVKKVPRVVMVDQLWMWILDESEPNFHCRSSIFQITSALISRPRSSRSTCGR
jgi:hypothetical protein